MTSQANVPTSGRNQSKRNLIVLVLLVVAAAVLWLNRKHAPTLASLNGAYSNPQCGVLVLKDGLLSRGARRFHYSIELNKVGLFAHVVEKDFRFCDGGPAREEAARPGALQFDDTKRPRALSGSDYNGRQYVFKRAS